MRKGRSIGRNLQKERVIGNQGICRCVISKRKIGIDVDLYDKLTFHLIDCRVLSNRTAINNIGISTQRIGNPLKEICMVCITMTSFSSIGITQHKHSILILMTCQCSLDSIKHGCDVSTAGVIIS